MNMDSYNFNWLNNDDDIMDTLVGIESLPDQQNQVTTNVGANIIDYLLFNQDDDIPDQGQLQQPQQSALERELQQVVTDTIDNPQLPFSVIEEKDNFVTFTPLPNATPKKQATPKKNKSRGPIFVTASPKTFSKKLKKYPGNPQSNSSDDNSDDDNENISSQMTSKEKRLHRNKISARNFRVRRKEYIQQLQNQVKEQAQTIHDLRKENEELRKSNEELMNHVLTQPITPPSTSTSNHDSFTTSSSSASEGNHSPEAPPLPATFQTQLNNLYDFNLFDNLQLSQPQNEFPQNLFYFNHAVIPDWDISRVLSDKGEILATEEEQREMTKDLLNNYPLLAPALMSIVLRHTLTMEHVAGLAEDLKKELYDDLKSTLPSDEETESLKASMNRLKIEDSDKPAKKDGEEEDELAILSTLLTEHYSHYAFYRATGKSHEWSVERYKQCMIVEKEKERKKLEKQANGGGKLQALQLYSRVAGDLLRNPQRMSRIKQVLKNRPEFKGRSRDTKEPILDTAGGRSLPTTSS